MSENLLRQKNQEGILKMYPEQDVLHEDLHKKFSGRPINPFKWAGLFINKILVIAELEIRKLKHDPTEMFTRALQPALWMLVFGEVFTRVRAIPTGSLSYLDFMAPGILAQSVLFVAIFYGIAIIWERDLGIVHKFLVSPTPRTALVLGKSLSAGIRALSQAVIIYVLSLLLSVNLSWKPVNLIGILIVIIISASLFSTFSLIIACIVKTRERFMGIGQVLTMPLFFASNAIYPIAIMPDWLKAIAHINPLTYEVDALRTFMINGGNSVYGIGLDFGALLLSMIILTIIAAKLYPNVVR
jgi:ABC-2 type transport system permease protein